MASLKNDYKDSLDSNINREESYRDYVDQKAISLEKHRMGVLNYLINDVVNCILYRDE